MFQFFNPDSPLMRVLGRVADLMILNIVFVIACVPVVTIGPALTALNYVALQMAEDRDSHIVRSFLRSFRQNFRQALVIWLLLLLFAAILWFDLSHVWGAQGLPSQIVRVLGLVAAVGYTLVLLYVFPVLARFHNTIAGTLRSAVGLALLAFPRTVSMFMLIFASVLLTFYTLDTFKYCVFFWLALGFAALAYANAFLLKKTFSRYTDQPQSPDSSETS